MVWSRRCIRPIHAAILSSNFEVPVACFEIAEAMSFFFPADIIAVENTY